MHGLGIDPSDESLYVATHEGLYVYHDELESLDLVAGRVQDFMGFTVVGPEEFLASGHPAPGSDAPAALGLIRSEDAGQTWSTMSLSGQADFHSIVSESGWTFGLESGSVLRSQDEVSWEQAAQTPPLADLALDPRAARLVGTSESGLVLSSDHGDTFRSVPDAPLLATVDFAPDGTLFGFDLEGRLFSSSDLASWQELDDLGNVPGAMAAESDGRVFAEVDDKILESTDSGQSFTTLIDL